MLIQFDRSASGGARDGALGVRLDQATGAVWDGPRTSGDAPGSSACWPVAAAATRLSEITAAGGVAEVTAGSRGSEKPATILAASRVLGPRSWARGGYAVFGAVLRSGPRPWLARPAGRVLFAGEHTSLRWQGYM